MRYLISTLLILISIIQAYPQASDTKSSVADNKYILILNSYNHGNNRITRISKNIRKELETISNDIIVNITYANIGKRSSYQADRFGMQGAFSNGFINRTLSVPKVLILVGDESWILYRDMNLRGVWENVPVVLCEVQDSIMNDYRNFYRTRTFTDTLMIPIEKSLRKLFATGIKKQDNTAKTLDLITQLIPEVENIEYISTRSYRDESTLTKLRQSISKYHPELSLNVSYQTLNNVDSIKLMLSGNNRESVILLCRQDLDPKVNKPTFVINQHDPNNSSSIIGGHVAVDSDMCKQIANVAFDIIQNNTSPLTIPFTYASRYANILDQQIIERYGLKDQADKLPNVIYINIPEPFFVRHFVQIMTIAILAVVIAIISIIVWRSRRNSNALVKSYENYKGLYNEYRAVYDNMPIGMILFSKNGSIINNNVESINFLDTLPSYGLNKTCSLTEIKKIKNPDFEVMYQTILDEETAEENTLMLIIDKSEVQRENQAKQKILDTMIFAIESSGWGVAQYNLVDYKGFATKNWYKNLCCKESDSFETAYDNLCKTDRIKIEQFLEAVRTGESDTFLGTILVDGCGGEKNWLQYAIKVLKFAPEQGQILLVELMINVNEQKEREQDLAKALTKAQESYIFKNAFIANTGNEIREILNQMNCKIDALLSSLDIDEQEKYAAGIEHDNKIMLEILKTIISISRPDTNNKSEDPELIK